MAVQPPSMITSRRNLCNPKWPNVGGRCGSHPLCFWPPMAMGHPMQDWSLHQLDLPEAIHMAQNMPSVWWGVSQLHPRARLLIQAGGPRVSPSIMEHSVHQQCGPVAPYSWFQASMDNSLFATSASLSFKRVGKNYLFACHHLLQASSLPRSAMFPALAVSMSWRPHVCICIFVFVISMPWALSASMCLPAMIASMIHVLLVVVFHEHLVLPCHEHLVLQCVFQQWLLAWLMF